MASLELKHTDVFKKNWKALNDKEHSVIINQGGTRSSKTYSILQCIIVYCLRNPNTTVSMVRISLPLLKKTVIKDVREILTQMGIYDVNHHNKTEQIYTFPNGSSIEFLSADSAVKLKGTKRDILYVNEATELSHSAYLQLSMRTKGKRFIDFNPEDMDHWVYDLMKEPKAVLIKSTYLDNPFLEPNEVQEIEDLIKVDQNYYKTYVLGEKPTSNVRIYNHFQQYDYEPDIESFVYGLDFGYNHPCALVKCSFGKESNTVYVQEEIYLSKLTTSELVDQMKVIGIDKSKQIFCDSARPEVIEELKRAGFTRATKSDKSVKAGIDKIKSMQVFIHRASINLWNEHRKYAWRTSNDLIIDEPIKLNDDGMDAMRYAIQTSAGKGYNAFYTNMYSF